MKTVLKFICLVVTINLILVACKNNESKPLLEESPTKGIKESKEKGLEKAKDWANPSGKAVDSVQKEVDSILDKKVDSLTI